MCDDFEIWRTFFMGVSRRNSPFGRTAMVLALDDSVFYLLGVLGANDSHGWPTSQSGSTPRKNPHVYVGMRNINNM